MLNWYSAGTAAIAYTVTRSGTERDTPRRSPRAVKSLNQWSIRLSQDEDVAQK